MVWRDAGFDALRNIQGLLECYEARYDPAVVPLPQDAAFSRPQSPPPSPSLSPISHQNFSKHLQKPQYYSVADYRNLYLSGQATPTDVAKALLPLIRRDASPASAHASAWLSTRVDLVLKAAEECTKRYREGRSLGPLDGVPAGVKDDFDLDGYTMTMGSLRNYAGKAVKSGSITNYSIRKLEEAGVIIMGKLTMHEFGMGWFILGHVLPVADLFQTQPDVTLTTEHPSTPSIHPTTQAAAHLAPAMLSAQA